MPKRFLVIRWSGLGDIVMTLPALAWLRSLHPGSTLVYLTDAAFAAIPRASSLVDAVIPIDRRGFQDPARMARAAGGLLAALVRLRSQRIEAAFDLQGFGETAVLAYLSGASRRAGRVKSSALRRRVYNRPVHADWERQHRSRFFLQAVAEALETPLPPADPGPPRLPAPDPPPGAPPGPVGLNIGASTESRRWSEKHFFTLADGLARAGLRVRFFLGPQERFLAGAVEAVCRERGWSAARHHRLEELMADLARCRLLVSNDTGPGHLAAALGVPVVTLFSTGDPENVRPLAPRARWFRDAGNINRIAPAEVLDACLALLHGAPA